jgi:hypothetical protein
MGCCPAIDLPIPRWEPEFSIVGPKSLEALLHAFVFYSGRPLTMSRPDFSTAKKRERRAKRWLKRGLKDEMLVNRNPI